MTSTTRRPRITSQVSHDPFRLSHSIAETRSHAITAESVPQDFQRVAGDWPRPRDYKSNEGLCGGQELGRESDTAWCEPPSRSSRPSPCFWVSREARKGEFSRWCDYSDGLPGSTIGVWTLSVSWRSGVEPLDRPSTTKVTAPQMTAGAVPTHVMPMSLEYGGRE